MTDYNEINYEKNMQMLSIAIKYCEEKLLHENIINELYNDNNLKKQLCLIELQNVKNQKEADILVYNLTEHSTPIREAASFKIYELIQKVENKNFFQTKDIIEILIKSITDINPTISRNAVEIIKYIKDKQYIYKTILKEINKTIDEIELIKKNRSYELNKKNFKLYWFLEGLTCISQEIEPLEELTNILEKTAGYEDYTIREKTAKLAKALELTNIINILNKDENIYVKRHLCSVTTN